MLRGSRHLTGAEAGYAAIEGEALAVAWCLEKARLFLLGCPNFLIVTDHRPLVKLLGNQKLNGIFNPRLLRSKEKTLFYKFHIKYMRGKTNNTADALSRYPSMRAEPDFTDESLEEEIHLAHAIAVFNNVEDCFYRQRRSTPRGRV